MSTVNIKPEEKSKAAEAKAQEQSQAKADEALAKAQADTKATTPVPASAQQPVLTAAKEFDRAKLQAHIDDVTKQLLEHAGKPGHNPHLWLRDNVEPLRLRLRNGEQSQQLVDAIKALKPVVPRVGKQS